MSAAFVKACEMPEGRMVFFCLIYLYKKEYPTGWHLPSDAEWTQLTDFVGSNSGTKLKAKIGWSDYGNGTDDYGFSVLPGGYRDDIGTFYNIGNYGGWWGARELDATHAWFRFMYYYYSNIYRGSYDKELGFSVRCVRD